MKILVLGDINSNHTRKWILSLQKFQNIITVFSFYPIKDNWHIDNQVTIHCFFKSQQVNLFKKLSYPLAYFKVKKIVSTSRVDIVNAHYASSYGLIGALIPSKTFNLNFWGTDIFVFPKTSYLHKKLIQFVLRKANQIFSGSKIMSKEIQRYTSKKINLIPFGIDCKEYQYKSYSQPKLNQEITIGIVKNLAPIYRIDIAIEAIKILNLRANYQFKLLIAGDGPLAESLKNQSSKAVTFLGKINQAKVPQLMHTFDLFLNPSDFESFGVSTIEAMACGTPVIAHNAGGSTEIITDKFNGFLYYPNTAEVLATKIESILEQVDTLAYISLNARNHVEKYYTIEIVEREISRYYSL